jgi:nitrogen regulatory protein PII
MKKIQFTIPLQRGDESARTLSDEITTWGGNGITITESKVPKEKEKCGDCRHCDCYTQVWIIMVVVEDEVVETILTNLKRVLRERKIQTTIFVSSIESATRIRTEETGDKAL